MTKKKLRALRKKQIKQATYQKKLAQRDKKEGNFSAAKGIEILKKLNFK